MGVLLAGVCLLLLLLQASVDEPLLLLQQPGVHHALRTVALRHHALLYGFLHSNLSLWLLLLWLSLLWLWRLSRRGSHLRLRLLLCHHRLLLLNLLLLGEHLLLCAKLVDDFLEMIKLSRVVRDPRL